MLYLPAWANSVMFASPSFSLPRGKPFGSLSPLQRTSQHSVLSLEWLGLTRALKAKRSVKSPVLGVAFFNLCNTVKEDD